LDNKLKTIPVQIALLNEELSMQTSSNLSRPAADIARVSMEACYTRAQLTLKPISEGLDIAANIVDSILIKQRGVAWRKSP
jgi:hypothetical protein